MSVTISLALATICFTTQTGVQECHPVLFGENTKPGHYQLIRRFVLTPGYGGDVIQFNEFDTTIQAIHRTWQGNPKQMRNMRLKSPDPKVRKITMGCINVDPVVYEKLVDCCSNDQLEITAN